LRNWGAASLYHRIQMLSQALSRRLSQRLSRISAAASVLPVCAACFAVALAGCKPLPPSKPASEWTAQEARGAAVFQQQCARCHYPTTTHPLHGPGLQALTKLKAMPSGAPPTDERLTNVILHGRGMMPATPLEDEQMQDLLAYLRTL
jgi:mono/diheme cytochrome c family protein